MLCLKYDTYTTDRFDASTLGLRHRSGLTIYRRGVQKINSAWDFQQNEGFFFCFFLSLTNRYSTLQTLLRAYLKQTKKGTQTSAMYYIKFHVRQTLERVT